MSDTHEGNPEDLQNPILQIVQGPKGLQDASLRIAEGPLPEDFLRQNGEPVEFTFEPASDSPSDLASALVMITRLRRNNGAFWEFEGVVERFYTASDDEVHLETSPLKVTGFWNPESGTEGSMREVA